MWFQSLSIKALLGGGGGWLVIRYPLILIPKIATLP